jgi:hypothetical protein
MNDHRATIVAFSHYTSLLLLLRFDIHCLSYEVIFRLADIHPVARQFHLEKGLFRGHHREDLTLDGARFIWDPADDRCVE